MKPKILPFLFCLFLYGGIAAQNFTIKGKVVDSETNEPLFGASIIFEGGFSGVATSLSGDFTMVTSAGGEQVLLISYLGYETKRLTINIENQENNIGTIKLGADAQNLDVFEVRASLEGQQRAFNQQRTADNIKNVISADLIGRFPDLNVAEAMQRVPGVNIQRDKGEGSTVSIRGTPQHFTAIQINGEQIPSVQQDGSRNEALDLIPADQLSSMEITKAPTSDMDGDAIGGVINLRTPVARKLDLAVRAESALGYNDLSGGLNGIGKIRLDKRFFSSNKVPEGKLGVILGASYYSTNNSEDRIDATWQGIPRPVGNMEEPQIVMSNYQFRSTINERERIGATATFDYKFNSNHEVVFNYMYNRREDNDLRNRLRFDMDRSGSTFQRLDSITNGRIRRDINIFDELKTNQSFNLQGFHTLGLWKIDWSAYYTISNRTFSSDRGDFAQDNVGIVTDNLSGIYADVPQFRSASNEQSFYDPFFYSDFRRYEEDFETTDATNLVTRVDLIRNFTFGSGNQGYFKFGGKIRSQTNSKFRDNRVLRFNDPNGLINTTEAFLRVLSGSQPISFMNDSYRFGPLIGRNNFQSYINANRLFLTEGDDAWDSRRLSLSDTYDAFEDIYAGYAMTRLQLNNWMFLAGLRYEFNQVVYDAFEVFRVGTDVQGTPLRGGTDYGFLLPNLHVKYNLDKFRALRFSAVVNYARPNFVDIVPFVNYDADAITLRLGNPDLQPARAINFDLMYEHYFANVGIFSVGAFFKDIDQFQFSRIDPSLLEDFPGYPGTQGFIFRQEQNGENAKVGGIEVNFVRALDFLPGVLSNLNIDANYTYAYSDAFTQDRRNISLPGQAQHTFNTALSGDFGKFTGRIMANYNGDFVSSLASQRQDDIIQEQRLQLDASANYNLNSRWRLFGEWVNITNSPSIRYQGDRSRISRIAYFGWWTRVGVGFRF
ncbi:TonB-dependent receptor [Belliella pelovolcani]|uniref:TonB-dependent receptor n=1 Tax=Belliella pelovolcani TaxID=529505 RepID=A0A1N7PI51_9BACT|nr:TonB-dependent receptor [Belliella pelovolcani]SIT10271.1 TonB-dependent receptor [Belliella pelovolcani]